MHAKIIPGFPGYRVTDKGTVYSFWERYYPKGKGRVGVKYRIGRLGKKLKFAPQRGGYLGVSIKNGQTGRKTLQLVHRLVLLAFVGPCPEGCEARHFPDRNPKNNRLTNLSWATKKVNQKDRIRHGTHSRGEKHGIAKLTNAQAEELRKMVSGGLSRTAAAKKFGISGSAAGRIVQRRTYRD